MQNACGNQNKGKRFFDVCHTAKRQYNVCSLHKSSWSRILLSCLQVKRETWSEASFPPVSVGGILRSVPPSCQGVNATSTTAPHLLLPSSLVGSGTWTSHLLPPSWPATLSGSESWTVVSWEVGTWTSSGHRQGASGTSSRGAVTLTSVSWGVGVDSASGTLGVSVWGARSSFCAVGVGVVTCGKGVAVGAAALRAIPSALRPLDRPPTPHSGT